MELIFDDHFVCLDMGMRPFSRPCAISCMHDARTLDTKTPLFICSENRKKAVVFSEILATEFADQITVMDGGDEEEEGAAVQAIASSARSPAGPDALRLAAALTDVAVINRMILACLIVFGASCGGGCPYHLTERVACNRKCCPLNCLSYWGSWTTCVGCGNRGTQSRTLIITRVNSCGGAACPSTRSQSRRCTASA
eukprot:gene3134-3602_t